MTSVGPHFQLRSMGVSSPTKWVYEFEPFQQDIYREKGDLILTPAHRGQQKEVGKEALLNILNSNLKYSTL